jgi:hypothetical protein
VFTFISARAIGLVLFAMDVRPSDGVGAALLVPLWFLHWTFLGRFDRARLGSQRAPLEGVVQTLWLVIGLDGIALLILGEIVVALAAQGALERSTVAAAPVVAAVVGLTILSFVGRECWVPRVRPGGASVAATYRSRAMAQMAWANVPALTAFVGVLVLRGDPWVYAIGLAPALTGLCMALPTHARLAGEQATHAARGDGDLLAALDAAPTLDLPRVLTTVGIVMVLNGVGIAVVGIATHGTFGVVAMVIGGAAAAAGAVLATSAHLRIGLED